MYIKLNPSPPNHLMKIRNDIQKNRQILFLQILLENAGVNGSHATKRDVHVCEE